jgi:hypothetical protein
MRDDALIGRDRVALLEGAGSGRGRRSSGAAGKVETKELVFRSSPFILIPPSQFGYGK